MKILIKIKDFSEEVEILLRHFLISNSREKKGEKQFIYMENNVNLILLSSININTVTYN